MMLLFRGVWLTVPYEHTSCKRWSPPAFRGGRNIEGKEVRYGPDPIVLWAVAMTQASNGTVTSMHDSFNSKSRSPRSPTWVSGR